MLYRVDIDKDRAGYSLGFAFALFEDGEDARRASDALDREFLVLLYSHSFLQRTDHTSYPLDSLFRGRSIEVFPYTRDDGPRAPSPPPRHNPFRSSWMDPPPPPQRSQYTSYQRPPTTDFPRSELNNRGPSSIHPSFASSSQLSNPSTVGYGPPTQAQAQSSAFEDSVGPLAVVLKAAAGEADPAAL